MRRINIIPSIFVLGWLVTLLLTLSAAFGSYGEAEPHAGNILFTAAGVILVIGLGLYYKFKPTLLKSK